MGLRHLPLLALALAACSSAAEGDPPPPDSTPPPLPDGRACVGDTVEACGAACTPCLIGDREVASCDGVSCSTACMAGAPRCSEDTCSQLAFSFESGQLDGTFSVTPGMSLGVRDFNGSPALAVDAQGLNGAPLEFRIQVCLAGIIDLRTKTLSMKTFFQSGTATGSGQYVQVYVPSQQQGALIGTLSTPANQWLTFSRPLSASQFSGVASEITVQVGAVGDAFSGTIWFDDLKIE